MPTLKWDTTAGSGQRGTFTTDGWRVTRTATVSGLNTVGQAKYNQAKNSLGVQLGAPHPSLPDLFASNIDVDLRPNDIAICRVNYEPKQDVDKTDPGPESYQITFGATMVQEQVNTDRDGKIIVVKYIDYDGVTRDKIAGKQYQQSLTVSTLRPQTTVTYRRTETTSPGAKAREYIGKTNVGPCPWHPQAEYGEWMCMGITGSSPDSGATWEVEYAFQQTLDGWNPTVVYIDPETGRPPHDVNVKANQLLARQGPLMYFHADFGALLS